MLTKTPINQAYINGVRVDVVSPTEYMNNSELYDPKTTCIMMEDVDYILPVRTTNVDLSVPGFYMTPGVYGPGASPFIPIVPPTQNEMGIYSKSNIVDFSNVTTMAEYLAANAELVEQERKAFLSDQPDDVVRLTIDEVSDTPLMILCKSIINSKFVTSKFLENRMGNNYNNNMRLLKNKNDISYNKAVEILNCIDVKITATADNAISSAVYPMQSPITYDLNSGINGGCF
jgi:hypothetical protein